MNKEGMSLKESGVYLSLSYKTIQNYIHSGKLPYFVVKDERNKDTYRIEKRHLDKFIQKRRKEKEERESTTSTPFSPDTSSLETAKNQDYNSQEGKEKVSGEVQFLREEITRLHQQLTTKDSQIDNLNQTITNITNLNQNLLLITQGVSAKELLTMNKGEPQPEPLEQEDDFIDIEPVEVNIYRDKILKLIKKRKKKGLTNQKVSDYLNKKGYKTLSGKGKWHRKSISRILKGKE